MAGKTVAKKEEAGLPAAMMEQLAGYGEEFKETMTRDDMSIPFLRILQSLSPECTKGEPEFIKGAEPSMLIDTITQELFVTMDDDDNAVPAPFDIVSIHYKDSYLEWVPRNQGGGLVAEYSAVEGQTIHTQRNDSNQDIIVEGSALGTPGNQLAYTHTHYVFVVFEDGRILPYAISMASTQVKPSKNWNAMISRKQLPNGKTPPRFFGKWSVTTRRRSNDSGSWYVWEFLDNGDILSFGEEVAASIMEKAADLRRSIDAGDVSADHGAEAAKKPTGDGVQVDENGDEIPF